MVNDFNFYLLVFSLKKNVLRYVCFPMYSLNNITKQSPTPSVTLTLYSFILIFPD